MQVKYFAYNLCLKDKNVEKSEEFPFKRPLTTWALGELAFPTRWCIVPIHYSKNSTMIKEVYKTIGPGVGQQGTHLTMFYSH